MVWPVRIGALPLISQNAAQDIIGFSLAVLVVLFQIHWKLKKQTA
ncbi:hypothetical protein [Sphaerochaeta sp.]